MYVVFIFSTGPTTSKINVLVITFLQIFTFTGIINVKGVVHVILAKFSIWLSIDILPTPPRFATFEPSLVGFTNGCSEPHSRSFTLKVKQKHDKIPFTANLAWVNDVS